MKTLRLLILIFLSLTILKNGQAKERSFGYNNDEAIGRAITSVKHDLVHPRHLSKQEGQMQYVRPTLPYSYRSSDGHFLIHYTLSGDDAVDATSTNPDGVPDYVFEAAQIAERSYHLLIDTLGFQTPPVDNESSPETDIYIVNWGGSAYAYTYDENPVLSTDRPYDYTAFTVIDNDYEEYASTGIVGLQVTIAHEYFHIVHLGYNWWEDNGLPNSGYLGENDQYFLEWCSTWFEERAYPAVNDYVYYVRDYFNNPVNSVWNDDYAYALGPFLRMILEHYGEDLLVKVWDKIKTDYAFESLQAVLADDYGADLAELWNEFVYRCYFTGKRYDPELSLSSDARDFPLLQISNRAQYTTGVEFNTTIAQYATVPYRVTFSQDILCGYNVSTTYTSDVAGRFLFIKQGLGRMIDEVTLNQNQLVGDAESGDSLLVFLTNSSINSGRTVMLTVSEVSDIFPIVTKIDKLYPNPYSPTRQEYLTIELQIGQIVRSINTTWYDLRGREAYRKNFEDGLIELGTYIFTFSSAEMLSARLASGVYIIQIEVGTKILTRKVLILK